MQNLREIGGRRLLKVAVINRKGGTGKTFVTANLGGELAQRGLNVGLVDTDAQGGGHLGLCFGMAVDHGNRGGLFRIMTRGEEVWHNSYRVPLGAYHAEPAQGVGNIQLISADEQTFRIPYLMPDDPTLFGRLMDEFAEGFDLDAILVDTGPSMSLFDASIYAAADAFLFVTQPETLASVGINDSFSQIERLNAKRVERGLAPNRILGIIPNKVQARLREHTTNLNALGEAFGGLVWQPIYQWNAFMQMAARGQIVRAYARGREAAAMVALGDQFERTVTTWLTDVSIP